MKDILGQLLMQARGAWRYRWYALATAWVIVLAGWVYETPAFVSAARKASLVVSACAGAAHTRLQANTPADRARAIVFLRCTPESYGPRARPG